jgi:hypothetical protein
MKSINARLFFGPARRKNRIGNFVKLAFELTRTIPSKNSDCHEWHQFVWMIKNCIFFSAPFMLNFCQRFSWREGHVVARNSDGRRRAQFAPTAGQHGVV